MLKIISVWVNSPTSSYGRDRSLVGHEYQTEQAMCKDLEKLYWFGGGLFVKDLEENTIFRQGKIRIVEYNVVCSCAYAERDPQYNQAPYEVIITATEVENA